MDRRTGHLVAIAAGTAPAAGAFWLLGTTGPLAIALGIAVGALARLSIAHPDLLGYGHHPPSVSRWGGAAAGFTVAVSMLVYAGSLPAAASGVRFALATLVLGTTWAGVGFGVALARADAAAERG